MQRITEWTHWDHLFIISNGCTTVARTNIHRSKCNRRRFPSSFSLSIFFPQIKIYPRQFLFPLFLSLSRSIFFLLYNFPKINTPHFQEEARLLALVIISVSVCVRFQVQLCSLSHEQRQSSLIHIHHLFTNFQHFYWFSNGIFESLWDKLWAFLANIELNKFKTFQIVHVKTLT